MKNILLQICMVLLACSAFLPAQKEIDIIAKSPFRICETVKFYSETLEEDRLLNIYLPHGYDPDSAKTYPVIYLLDGSADEDFIHIAGLVQFGSFSWTKMLPEAIVVGIANVDRRRDFTYPSKNEEERRDFPTTGKSETFITSVENEILPLIAKNYRINGTRTLIGQSLGGLLATEILFKHPHLFDNYIIISPSL